MNPVKSPDQFKCRDDAAHRYRVRLRTSFGSHFPKYSSLTTPFSLFLSLRCARVGALLRTRLNGNLSRYAEGSWLFVLERIHARLKPSQVG